MENLKYSKLDSRGGLVLPFDGKTCNDQDWLEYSRLKIDDSVKSILPNYLPSDFSDEACRLVDEFRHKTVNESVEWLLYFDYWTGEVIYCWKGESGECKGNFDISFLCSKHIASIHNHIDGYYSVPSPENFDILENDFEDYEVITSIDSFWTVEFKGAVDEELRENFQSNLSVEFDMIEREMKSYCADELKIGDMIENLFSDYLEFRIDKNIGGIPLILNKMEYG